MPMQGVANKMMKLLFVCLCSLSTVVVFSLPVIHVVPHSHCDAGYRLSFQEYYDKQVHSILDTMLVALNTSTSRKFVWEESSFLQYWWVNDATDAQKSLMKQLITDKRLEMIGGGWTMHDEAVNNVPTILSQMALGLKFLNDSLNIRPKHEWHIDPFGHSIMMPELYSALQYDAIVINRIPDDIKQQMRKNQHLEFMWTSSLTGASMFTHVLDMHYSTPLIIGLTTQEKALSLAAICTERLKSFKTDHLLLPFGSDFNFINATEKFTRFEEIMDYINTHPDVFNMRLQFSTLDGYFSAIKMTSVEFPTLSDVDFFPYIACYPCFSEPCGGVDGFFSVPCGHQTPDAYWSGFYSSKPAQKLLTRQQEQAASVLDILNCLSPRFNESIHSALVTGHQTLALLTHHDAITGTSFPSAYDDYNDRLHTALRKEQIATGLLEEYILCGNKTVNSFTSNTTVLLAKLTDSNKAVITVFNSLMESRSDYARINVPVGLCVQVSAAGTNSSEPIQAQQVVSTLYVPIHLNPLEIKTLILTKSKCTHSTTFQSRDITKLSNGYLQLQFNDKNHISSLSDISSGKSIGLSVMFTEVYEKTASLLDPPISVCDGSNVYTYVPDKGSLPLSPTDMISSSVTSNGPLIWEVQQNISSANDQPRCPVTQTIRLFKPIGQDIFFKQFLEVQNTVGPLSDTVSSSILFSINTTLNTESLFTTYTSGLYPMNRQYNDSLPSQGNNYPLVGRVSMKDDKQDIGVVISTKRPMAVTSREGTLDLLVHRLINLIDDPRGLDESVMSDPMYMGLITLTDDINEASYTAMSYSHSPFTVYGSIIPSLSDWYEQCDSIYTPLHQSLPRTVKLLGMEVIEPPVKGSTQYRIGMRLVNIDSESSSINLFTLFTSSYKVLSVVESTPDYLIQLNTLDYSQTWKLSPYKLASAIITLSLS